MGGASEFSGVIIIVPIFIVYTCSGMNVKVILLSLLTINFVIYLLNLLIVGGSVMGRLLSLYSLFPPTIN